MNGLFRDRAAAGRMKARPTRSPRVSGPKVTRPRTKIAPKWAWHYRTLTALRDHLIGGTGDRERELFDAMEPPSLHPEDFADELYDRDLALILPKDPTEALHEIDDAIRRLKTGTYGKCEATKRLIPKARLQRMPWCRYVDETVARLHQRNAHTMSL